MKPGYQYQGNFHGMTANRSRLRTRLSHGDFKWKFLHRNKPELQGCEVVKFGATTGITRGLLALTSLYAKRSHVPDLAFKDAMYKPNVSLTTVRVGLMDLHRKVILVHLYLWHIEKTGQI
ncbi:hypothetical protein CHS0354_009759 [Potamilus streckersoni]|uniref:Uncharacterized protein n=1 Tax=Potamilus streckersoni TaxID=2493646 RepID=A0AAE0SUP2_9BIVA|nr:hypothetical protein CHS0354_009759 [Potamilus streckersoni]